MTPVIVTDDGHCLIRSEVRPVKRFEALDACTRDRDLRGKCVLFDLHGFWWSAPMELTVLEIDEAIAVELDAHNLRRFPSHLGDVFRPKVA